MNFNHRIEQLEIMDEEELSPQQLSLAYKDINKSNSLLGGFKVSYDAISNLIQANNRDYSVLDIGCGEGEQLRYLARRFRKEGLRFHFYGLDLNEEAIEMARKKSVDFPELQFFKGDILSPNLELPKCDFVISTLTLHHFIDEKIPAFLDSCGEFATKALVINDLQRGRLPYYLFKIFSLIFIRSPIARNDGLISIRRGFSRNELEMFSVKLNQYAHHIKWKWAFRYVWVMQRQRQKNI